MIVLDKLCSLSQFCKLRLRSELADGEIAFLSDLGMVWRPTRNSPFGLRCPIDRCFGVGAASPCLATVYCA